MHQLTELMKDSFKSRVRSLKTLLKTDGIDYFILPNCDEFFSEYLPENEKRIEYLTGFTGSNALIIFGQKKSYFFTDGRYILQAKNEIDLSYMNNGIYIVEAKNENGTEVVKFIINK